MSSFWRTRASTCVADLDDLVGVDVVLDGQLAGGDDALGLVADVEQDLVAVDLDDDALDDVAVVEVLDGLVDGGEEVIGRTDVVDRDLLGGRLGQFGHGARHVGRDSDADRDECGRVAGPWKVDESPGEKHQGCPARPAPYEVTQAHNAPGSLRLRP